MKKLFSIEPHESWAKKFEINCPGDLHLFVDYDDVDHKEVDRLARKIVRVLNDFWTA